MTTWSSGLFGSGSSMEYQDPMSRGRLPLPEARRISPAELQAGGVSPTYSGSTSDVWVTSSTQRYASPCPTLEYASLMPASSQRVASPIREPQQYVTMVKGGTGREMMEVERINLMPEAPIVSVKKVDMEVAQVDTDVVRTQYFETRLREVEEMIMNHVSALGAKCSGMETQLAKMQDLLIESGNQQKENLRRMSKIETDMQNFRGGETDLWQKERVLVDIDDMRRRIEGLEEAVKGTRTTVEMQEVSLHRSRQDLEHYLRSSLQQNFSEVSAEWRNFVNATENRLAMGEESRASLLAMVKKTQDEVRALELNNTRSRGPDELVSRDVTMLRKDLQDLTAEVRSFENLSEKQVLALARAELEPLQALFGSVRALEDSLWKDAIDPVQRLTKEVAAFERVTQYEVRELLKLEMAEHLVASDTIKTMANELQRLKQEVAAFERLTQAEVRDIVRLEIRSLEALQRDFQALKRDVEAIGGGGISQAQVKELLRLEFADLQSLGQDLQALKREVYAFERLTQAEVRDIIRLEFGGTEAIKDLDQQVKLLQREMGAFERLTEAQVVTLARAEIDYVQREVASINDRIGKLQGGNQIEDIEELRRVVGDLAQASSMQSEQILSLSGGSLQPSPQLEVELDKDLTALRNAQEREEEIRTIRRVEERELEQDLRRRAELREEELRTMRRMENKDEKSSGFFGTLFG